MKSKVYKTKVDTRDEMFASISDAAARIKKLEDQLRRTKRDLHTRFAERTEGDGGIFEYLL
jgi:ribosome-associated translation inhibitor RaiA